MVPFDPRAYEDEVVKPLRRRLPHLPDDLLTRYAIDLDMDAGQLRERTAAVLRLWARIAQRAGQSGLVCAQFLREHDELTRSPAADLTDPRWWQQRERVRNRQLEPEIADLAALLAAGHGELGVITDGQLRAAAAAHGTLGDADLDRARSAAALRVVPPVGLPTAAGMRGRFDSLTTKLIAAGVDSIPRLLFPGLTAFGLLRGFTVVPVPGGRTGALNAAAVAERGRELDTLPDNAAVRATREAIGMLATEAAAGTDLTALCLFHLLGPVRDKRAEGAGARTLFGLLQRTGLAGAEAGRIAVSVLAEPTGRADPLAAVAQLLSDGRLLAAQQAAEPLTGPAGEAGRTAVRSRRDEVERLRRAAAADLRAGDHERAAERLREAVCQATDLPGLAADLERIPAAAVLEVAAVPDGTGVRITWRPAPEHDEHTRYRVLRGAGPPPVDASDGIEIPPEPSAGSSPVAGVDPVAIDTSPPPGRPLRYAVLARSGTGRWSRPVGAAPVRIVPPVTGVQVDGGSGVVLGHWLAHPDVSGVEVRRHPDPPAGAGELIPVDGVRSFRDASAVDGTRYRYAITAVYSPPEAGGELLRSEPVLVGGATRPEPRPVPVLSATPLPDPGAPAVRLGWRQPAGSEIVIRHAAQPCPWAYGQWVPAAELAGWGRPLDGERSARGDAVTLLARLPVGRRYCVPFTLGPAGGLRGQDAVVDLVPPVRRLRAQRFGDDIRLSWAWPDAVGAADVVWAGGTRRITRTRYREEGGCHLVAVSGATRVDVHAVLPAGGGADEEGRASPVSVEVHRRPVRIDYRMRRHGHRWTGGVHATAEFSGAELVPAATVVIIASAGPVLPAAPDAGIELLRDTVRIEPGVPVSLQARVPSLPRPYWLRCFLLGSAGALLVDPPVDQLKVT